jgi:hypothetical protein
MRIKDVYAANTTEARTQARPGTAIVTGASRGIGAGLTKAFLDLGYHVVANALDFADSALVLKGKLALVDGNIGQVSTATRLPVSNRGVRQLAIASKVPIPAMHFAVCFETSSTGNPA